MAENTKALSLLLGHMKACHDAEKKRATGFMDATAPHAANDATARFALNYLDVFGYLSQTLANWSNISLQDILDAIRQYQGLIGLRTTGVLDVASVRAMAQPRCGCSDNDNSPSMQRLRAFATANLAKWQKSGITYAIADYLPTIDRKTFELTMAQSFAAWTKHINFGVAAAVNGSPDVVISTGQGAQSQFDGPGGTLAWAYLPDGQDSQLQLKFDLGETWSTSPAKRGILLANVATHEIGHILGLTHSRKQGALMAPIYNAAVADPQLEDDIPRIQARYGAKPAGPIIPPTDPTPSGRKTVTINGENLSITLDGNKIA